MATLKEAVSKSNFRLYKVLILSCTLILYINALILVWLLFRHLLLFINDIVSLLT